jgi:hypothetical protein
VASRTKVLRVYVDTSVIGGCFDDEFETWSNALLKDFRSGRYIPILSDLLATEIAPAPPHVQAVHRELLQIADDVVESTPEALSLRARYAKRGVLGPKYFNDMLHIAIATVASADALASWNFKHIVRLDKIRLFNEINVDLGYPALNIYSPREIASHEEA